MKTLFKINGGKGGGHLGGGGEHLCEGGGGGFGYLVEEVRRGLDFHLALPVLVSSLAQCAGS